MGLLLVSGLCIAFWANSRMVIVVGNSMEPTHPDGTRLVACHAYWMVGPITQGDVIAFNDPTDPTVPLIKRVRALGGGFVPPADEPIAHLSANSEYRVPIRHLYVLGDNREVSEDSRWFGPVPRDQVIGKCIHMWGGDMALPFVLGFGAVGLMASLWILTRRLGSTEGVRSFEPGIDGARGGFEPPVSEGRE